MDIDKLPKQSTIIQPHLINIPYQSQQVNTFDGSLNYQGSNGFWFWHFVLFNILTF